MAHKTKEIRGKTLQPSLHSCVTRDASLTPTSPRIPSNSTRIRFQKIMSKTVAELTILFVVVVVAGFILFLDFIPF
jgi:hypothetical protein